MQMIKITIKNSAGGELDSLVLNCADGVFADQPGTITAELVDWLIETTPCLNAGDTIAITEVTDPQREIERRFNLA